MNIIVVNLNSIYHKVNELHVEDTNYPKMEIIGDLAYVADHSYGLRTYDITDPVNPILINSLALSHPIREILIQETIVYLVCYDNIMYIIDINEPSVPTILSQYTTIYPCVDICANNQFAFIVIHYEDIGPTTIEKIEVVDISDPTNPIYVSDFTLPSGGRTLSTINNIVYIGTYAGLFVYDISDPNIFVQIDWIDVGNVNDLKFHNDLLYFDGRDGLSIIDYSDPSNNHLLVTYDDLDFKDSEIIGNTLYGAFNSFLRVIDITDPLNAFQVHYYITIENCNSVAATENIVYINSSHYCFNIIDVTDSENPYLFNYYDVESNVIAKSPNDLFMLVYGNCYDGLHFYDMTDAAAPEYIYSHISHGNAWSCGGFYIDDQICCSVFGTIDQAELYIYNLNRLQTSPLWSTTAINYDNDNPKIKGIDRKDDYIYIAWSTNGIMVIDVSDIMSPAQVLNYDIEGFCHDLTIKGDYLYYVNIDGLYVLDISEPLQPFQVGFWDSDNRAEQFVLYGDFAYIADYDGGIKVLDISNPTNPSLINTVTLNSTSRIDYDPIIRDGKLIITDRHWNEIMVFDLSNPVYPVLQSNCRWDKYTNDMELFGNYLYCANGKDVYDVYGLTVLDFSSFNPVSSENPIPEPTDSILNPTNYPNPFNPSTSIEFSLLQSSEIELSIFNVKGQKIKTLAKTEFTKGSNSVIWNGDDGFGKPVSSGLYFYKLKVNDKTEAVKKCLLLK